MQEIFLDVLEINIAVSVMILILCLFSGKLRNRYGAKWMRSAWLLLAVRLLIPYNFSLPFTEITLPDFSEFERKEQILQNPDSIQAGLEAGSETINAGINDLQTANGSHDLQVHTENAGQGNMTQSGMENNTAAGGKAKAEEHTEGKRRMEYFSVLQETLEKSGLSYSEIMVRIWIFGIGVCLLYLAFGYFIFYYKNNKSLYPVKDKEMKKKIEAAQRKLIGRACIPVYQSRRISSPMMMGIFFPKLVIPASGKEWSMAELELMAAHELCHYKKKDLCLKLLMALTGCFHWFNPIVWVMKKQFFYEIELACDESVLLGRDEEERDTYARMMLSFAGNKNRPPVFSTGFWENRNRMKKRIDHIFDDGRKKKGIPGIVTMGMLILFMGVLVSCGYQPKEAGETTDRYAAEGNHPQDTSLMEDPETEDARQRDGQESFDYNHIYNDTICSYGDAVYLSRQDGIYWIKEGEEEMLFENPYALRRGMALYQGSLYFCGSAQRGEKEAATIYRMHLDNHEVEDGLAAFSQLFEVLYYASIYEDKLYVSNEYGQEIGFELSQTGEIVSLLDETAEDFLYREYNDYMALDLERMNAGYDTEEYWSIMEELEKKYHALADVAALKKMLQGKQVVSQYKDELLISIFLEDEDGIYEHLCDGAGYPMLVTETGLYYAANERGEIWYVDYETKVPQSFLTQESEMWDDLSLLNYDADYVYLYKSRNIGWDMEENRVSEKYLLRVPRQGGEAEKIYQFENGSDIDGARGIYRHCGVVDGRMYIEGHETISLYPDVNGMQAVNSGEPSEDAAEMARVAEAFALAYFQDEEELLCTFLTEDFAENVEGYPYPESAGQIEGTHIGGLPEGNLPVGIICNVSYEFRGHAETDDALAYLSMEMVKTQQGFQIKWYGLEM